jgi:hypothetical protein
LFIDTSNLGPSRSLPQTSCQLRELFDRSDRVDFYPAVVQIARISCEIEIHGDPLDEVTETDPLDAPPYKVATGGQGF